MALAAAKLLEVGELEARLAALESGGRAASQAGDEDDGFLDSAA